MTKTWETLFNLSSFMKYLLAEVLPYEKVTAPSYVLQSLYELLTATAACIENIKAGQKLYNFQKPKTYHLPEHGLSSGSWQEIEDEKHIFHNLNKNYSGPDLDILENKPAPSPKSVSNENIAGVTKLESVSKSSRSKVLPDKFIKLSDEMHSGRPFGHYCRPCDLVIFSKDLWEKHHSYKIHILLNDNCENNHVSCDYCHLIVFASTADSELLFNYHQEKHFESDVTFQHITRESNDEIENFRLSEKKNTNAIEGNHERNYSETDFKTFNFKACLDTDFKATISPIFLELNKQMISGTEKGFYCFPCDKSFDSAVKWNKHFQMSNVHVNETDVSESFEKCENCQLVIFANSSIHYVYSKYHKQNHDNLKEELTKVSHTAINRSLEAINGSLVGVQDITSQGSFNSESVPNNRDQASNSYYIVYQFKRFNSTIHANNLQGCFYCRPCNGYFSAEDEWKKHILEEKHLQLMKSRKFKNWEGKCAYCSLTILGTRAAVKYYMEFHTVAHKQTVSYEEKLIDPQHKTQKKSKTKKIPSYSNPTILNEEEENVRNIQDMDQHHKSHNNLRGVKEPDEQDKPSKGKKKLRNRGKKNILSTSSSSGLCKQVDEGVELEKIEYLPDNVHNNKIAVKTIAEKHIEKDLCNGVDRIGEVSHKVGHESMIFQLINSRIEQNKNTGQSNFGALCLVCEISIDDAFNWEDHLIFDENHIQKTSAKDRRASVQELNINFFGDRDVLMKYKSLIKGNMSFIDN